MGTLGPSDCQICDMDPRYRHTVREHEMAEALRDRLVQYVRDDAFLGKDSRLTYSDVVAKFNVPTTARKVGRVLDAVECMLVASGWPKEAAAGVSAYVVSAGGATKGQPSTGWMELWDGMSPEDARAEARSYLYQQAMGIDV